MGVDERALDNIHLSEVISGYAMLIAACGAVACQYHPPARRVAVFDDIEGTLMSEHKSDISRRAMLVRMGAVAATSVLLPNVLHGAAGLPNEAGDVAIMYPVPEWLTETNRESWKQIVRFYEWALKERLCSWDLEPVLRLVRGVEQSSLAGSFRAGQAVFMLMVSTKERHGLEAGDPYVIVQPEPTGKIGMAYFDPSGQLAASEDVPEPEARACLERMLMRLWADSPLRGQLP